MDTREMKLKQGAAADLLQQGPHVEVAESGTSALSSDEERLAAGISTIGLQAKGPSGAQWRRLSREGGMKEGTWMAERPLGGAPSRVKGMAGGWGSEETPLRLEYTIPRRVATQKKPGTPKCGLGHIRKLMQYHLSLLGSRG
jgi:hypothetical protein